MASTMRFDRWEDTLGNSVNMTQVSGGSGLVPIIPTSVAVGSGTSSVSANGLVTFTGASSITLNGVFNSAFENYRAMFKVTSTSGNTAQIGTRLSNAGTPDQQANYTYGWLRSYTTNVNNNATTGGTYFWINGNISTAANPAKLSYVNDIFSPFTSNITSIVANGNHDSTTEHQIWTAGGYYNATTSFSGINWVATSGGTMSGTLQVYGYR